MFYGWVQLLDTALKILKFCQGQKTKYFFTFWLYIEFLVILPYSDISVLVVFQL